MKTNYEFPYKFFDFTNSGICHVEQKFEANELVLFVDLGEFQLHDKIDIVIEVLSTQTFYRKLYVLSEKETFLKIKYDQLGSKLEYAILLIAKYDGEIDFEEQIELYEKGDCIGILRKNIIAFEEEEGFSGLIKIAPTSKNNIAYDLTSDWITIELPSETYEKFYPWQKDDSTIPFALASLGNSCIQFAIIKALREPEYKEKKWWETLTQLIGTNGYKIDDLSEDDIPGVTNKLLGNCIQEMIDAAVPVIDHGDTSILA